MLILNWDVDYEGEKGDSRVSSYVEGFYVAVEVVIQEGDVFLGGRLCLVLDMLERKCW